MKEKIAGFFIGLGISVSYKTQTQHVEKFIDRLQQTKHIPMHRVGGHGDGGYWIPQDLSGITSCFSPGVASCSSFELDLAERGMEIFMADKSVAGPSSKHPQFHFTKRHIGSFTDIERGYISFEDWYEQSCSQIAIDGDKILQMDIEGGEYEVIHSITNRTLKNFRVLVIEFHNIHQLLNCNSFNFMEKAFRKLLLDFEIFNIEQNFAAGATYLAGKKISKLLEISFIRK
jgi:hypothetical protein